MDETLLAQLGAIDGLGIRERAPVSEYTRFGIGGPADLVVDANREASMIAALDAIRAVGMPLEGIGDGSNVIVSDAGFRGVVIRYRADAIRFEGTRGHGDAAAEPPTLVDETVAHGLGGVHTMTR